MASASPGPPRSRPTTFIGLLLLAVVALALTVTKQLVKAIGEAVGAKDATVTLWSIGRWF